MTVKTYKSSPKKLEYQRKYNAKNRERARVYAREYHRKNREKQIEYFKNKYKADPEKYKELNRKNYQEHREERLLQSKIKRSLPEEKEKINKRRIAYYAKNKVILNKKSNQWAKDNREKHYANGLRWREGNREKIRSRQRAQSLELKKEVFNFYGNQCACCGEKEFLFMTIDHINGDGAAHQKITGSGGVSTYRWLRKNNYPAGYQTLCYNCNAAKGVLEHCPVHPEHL